MKRVPIRFEKVGRKKIQVWYDNFEYFQPNDHVCGDCAIRAVAKALNLTWEDALTAMYNEALKIKDSPISRETIGAVLKANGFKWVATNPKRGEKRPIVTNFAKENNERTYVLNLSSHVVAAANGKYYDIWDSGDKPLYGYWVKE